jgi:hypothetical protein
MEADIEGGVAGFVLAGGYARLRRPPDIGNDIEPSRMIADFLAREV